jgi:hypothetical protein
MTRKNSHYLKIGQIPYARGEQARKILARSFSAKLNQPARCIMLGLKRRTIDKDDLWVVHLQASDKVLLRTGDHSPAARIHGVLVPVLEHSMGILEAVLDHHESLHCRQNRD